MSCIYMEKNLAEKLESLYSQYSGDKFTDNQIAKGKLAEMTKFLTSLEPVDTYTDRQKALFYYIKTIMYWNGMEDLSKAYKVANSGIQVVKNLENEPIVVDLFMIMAQLLIQKDRFMEAMNLFKECSEILHNLPNISEKARKRRMGIIYFHQGFIFSTLQDFKNAIEKFEVSIGLLETWGPVEVLAGAYSFTGHSHLYIGEYNKTLEYISKSQKI